VDSVAEVAECIMKDSLETALDKFNGLGAGLYPCNQQAEFTCEKWQQKKGRYNIYKEPVT
jgi:hypothetical protein